MKRTLNVSPEERATRSERMRKQWQDPEFRARRKAAVEAAVERNRETGETSRKKAANAKAMWSDPAKRARILAGLRKKLESGHAEVLAANMAKMKADADIEAKRRRATALNFERNRSKYVATIMAHNRRSRGFDVPARMWKEYRFLCKVKGLTARQAGIALGLVSQ